MNRRVRNGFSLLELMAVVTIMGIMAAVVLPRISGQARGAKNKTCSKFVRDLNNAIENYYLDRGTWPTSTDDLDAYYPEAIPACPADGTAYAIDSTTKRITPHTH